MVRKKAKKRPDPAPYVRDGLLMPTRLMKDRTGWRKILKTHLLENRDFKCRGCGRDLASCDAVHMHEGVFSKGKVEGWPEPWRILIDCELNSVLLCADCNLGVPPRPAEIWEEHCIRYGAATMLAWVDSLPFRLVPGFVNWTRQDLSYIEARKGL